MPGEREEPNEAPANAVRVEGEHIRISGELRTLDAAAIWTALRDASSHVRSGAKVEIDLSAVTAVDSDVMALLIELRSEIGAKSSRS